MISWHRANFLGKLMIVGCLLNVFMSILLASAGEMSAIFSMIVAALCGLCTYNPRYQHQDAKDINEGR
jgi:hypothetical protein